MGNLRVLVLSHMYPRMEDPAAGIFIHHQVRYLVRLGCEAVVVAPLPYVPKFMARNERRKGYRNTPKETEIDGIRVIYPRYIRPPGKLFHPFSCYTMFWGISKVVHKLVTDFQPHIIHAYTATPDGYAGLLLKKKYGLPFVVSLRGSDINVYPHRDSLTFRLTRRVIAEADKVTAVSNALKVAAEGIVRSQKEIAVVYTGCDLTRFSFNAEARSLLRRELGIAPESFVLIFIGHLLRTKGIFELVDAFRILCRKYHNTHLVFVGEGQDVQTLVAKVSEVGIEGQVHFVGRRPHDEISDWLSAADVLVLPSWHEGLPNVVVEAMACERPVVATKVGGIPEAVADGKSGILVERGDVKALANAIALLAEDPTRRAVMGAAGRQIVEERFTWERNAEKTIQVYREVLGEG